MAVPLSVIKEFVPFVRAKIRAKKSNQLIHISLYKKTKTSYYYVGFIRLKWVKGKTYETHSSLSRPNDYGKGYGVLLYSLAADYSNRNGFILRSSLYPSMLAKRVWNSTTLRKYYKISRRGKYWYIKPLNC